jgi:hypothetical protein
VIGKRLYQVVRSRGKAVHESTFGVDNVGAASRPVNTWKFCALLIHDRQRFIAQPPMSSTAAVVNLLPAFEYVVDNLPCLNSLLKSCEEHGHSKTKRILVEV